MKPTKIKVGDAELVFTRDVYVSGENIAIFAIDVSEGYNEDYLTLSTNLERRKLALPHLDFFVKLSGEHKKIIDVLEEKGFVKSLNEFSTSGYNTYGLYRVTELSFLNPEDEE